MEKDTCCIPIKNKKISCDQVAWLLAMADRYLPKSNTPSIDRRREMLKYAMLYEIMEIVGLWFLDDAAVINATPSPVRVTLDLGGRNNKKENER